MLTEYEEFKVLGSSSSSDKKRKLMAHGYEENILECLLIHEYDMPALLNKSNKIWNFVVTGDSNAFVY